MGITIQCWYDMQFRTLAASNPQLQWNLRHSEFWLDNLASQTCSFSLNTRWPCTYCGVPDRCPRCPFRTVHLSNDNASQRDNGSRLLTYREFNNSTCQRNPCCQHCGSPTHPAYRCRRGASSPLKSRVLGPVLPYDHSSSSANLLITPTKLLFSSSFLT